jgi:hypothetical protein
MTPADLTEAACTGVTLHLDLPDGSAAEVEVIDPLGPARLTLDEPTARDVRDNGAVVLLPPPPPMTLTVNVTARRIHFATQLTPPDSRLLAYADLLGADHPDAEAMRAALARIREAWRGGDHYPDLAEALQVIEENAAELRRLLSRPPAGD